MGTWLAIDKHHKKLQKPAVYAQIRNVVKKQQFSAPFLGLFCGFLGDFGRPETTFRLYCLYSNKTGVVDD
jgi:hypothetical protein